MVALAVVVVVVNLDGVYQKEHHRMDIELYLIAFSGILIKLKSNKRSSFSSGEFSSS